MMETRSQAQLEKLVNQQELMPGNQTSTLKQVFEMEDWIVELGQRKALLVPKTKQWMWYDRLHDEWTSANCGVNEGILLTIGNVAGVKKLPQPGNVSEWCIYQHGQQPFGPLRTEELVTKLITGELAAEIKVWSPLATTWLKVMGAGNEISFVDESGAQVSIITKKEGIPPPMPVPPQLINSNIPPPFLPK